MGPGRRNQLTRQKKDRFLILSHGFKQNVALEKKFISTLTIVSFMI